MYTTEFIKTVDPSDMGTINIRELKYELANYYFKDGTSAIDYLVDDLIEEDGNLDPSFEFNNENSLSLRLLIDKIKNDENVNIRTEEATLPWILL